MTPEAALVAGVCLVATAASALRAAALALRAAFLPLSPRAQDELLGASLAAVTSAVALVLVIGA